MKRLSGMLLSTDQEKINKMKSSFFLLLFSTVVLGAKAQTDKEPFLVKQFDKAAISEVEAKTSGGSITVIGGNNSQSRVEVYVTANNNEKLTQGEIQQRLDEDYELNVGVSGSKLSAVAKSKAQIRDWKKALNIAYKIYVPQRISSDLTTSGGSIHLENLSGSQKLSTSGGSLHLAKLSGKVKGSTSGGSIHLDDSRDNIELTTSGGSITATNSTGDLRLTTSGGSLELSNLKGSTVASTSGGGIRAQNVDGELKAHTSGGSIRMSGLTCSLETSTSGGNIDVAFRQLGNYVKISNSAGNVTLQLPKDKGLDLDLSGDITAASFANFNGNIDRHKVKGKLNGGGIPVSVGTSGRIQLQLQ